MSEVRNIPVGDLRLVVTDAVELQKGTRVADSGGITNLARHEHKLFCDAAGSGAAPYKVQIVFGDGGKITGRCSCMASRSRPYCKHAAALLVAWGVFVKLNRAVEELEPEGLTEATREDAKVRE